MHIAIASSTVLVVAVDGLRIGLPIDTVGEVVRMVAITQLPGAPAVVAGAVDLRGQVVGVIDLRRRLGRPARAPHLDDRLVSVTLENATVLVWVDDVQGVQSLDSDTIEPLQGGLEAMPHLAGVTRTAAGLLYMHDPHLFFSDREAAALDEALTSLTTSDPTESEQ